MNLKLLEKVSDLAIKTSNEVLLPNFARVRSQTKSDGSWLTIADTLAHEALLEQLPKLLDVPVLSEESTVDVQNRILSSPSLGDSNASYWCIDPLDGTSNFTQGIPYWCMSIALIVSGEVKLGVIYDPNRDECFAVDEEQKTTLNGIYLKPTKAYTQRTIEDSMGLIDFKRLETRLKLKLIERQPYRSQRSFGASALDFCWIAADRCQIYLHGKQKLWDYAAGLVILCGSGGKAKTIEGDRIFQNDLLPKSVLAASDATLFKDWQQQITTLLKTDKL